jgi:hypothetical protein
MGQIQATVAMNKQQSRLDSTEAATGGMCFGTRRNDMSIHQDLIPEPHTRTSKRSHKIFRQELPMSIPEELSDKHQYRTSSTKKRIP